MWPSSIDRPPPSRAALPPPPMPPVSLCVSRCPNTSHTAIDMNRRVCAASSGVDSSARTPSGWHPLQDPLLWAGTEEEALQTDALPSTLSPIWKVVLLSDGSVTRHLQLMTGQSVAVHVLEMKELSEDDKSVGAGLPPAVSMIDGPLLQRQVMLHLPDVQQHPYVYACSWWNAETVGRYLRDKNRPIWVSLSRERTELYREILDLRHGHSAWLEEQFGASGPFWARSYVFWHDGKPLTLIYESFSSKLCDYLGAPFVDDP